MAIRIAIYEDKELFRKSLEELLALDDSLEVVYANPSCENVLYDIENDLPDLILMDIDLPVVSGIEAVSLIRKIDKDVTIIMLTVFDNQEKIIASFEAGADGYLLKKNCADELISFIKDAMNGGNPMSPEVTKSLISSFQRSPNKYELTNREMEILKGLCDGLSYKMIAAEGNISFETVRSYMKNIYSKLDVHSATEAVSKTLKEHLI